MLILKFHPGMKCLHVFFSFFHPGMKFHPSLTGMSSSWDKISSRQKRVNSKKHFTIDRDDFVPGWNFTCKHPLIWTCFSHFCMKFFTPDLSIHFKMCQGFQTKNKLEELNLDETSPISQISTSFNLVGGLNLQYQWQSISLLSSESILCKRTMFEL